MMSSGVQNLLKSAGSWVIGLGVIAVVLVNQDAIRSELGLRLAPEDFGVVARDSDAYERERAAIEEQQREAALEHRRAQRQPERRRGTSRQEDPLFKTSVELYRGSGGHFHADAAVNGRTISVLVDTGATLVALSYEDASSIGISVRPEDFRYVSNTANGQARFARVVLDEVRIGNVSVRNVEAAVSQPGRLGTTLLGMSFLGKLRMEMTGGRLVLEQ